MVTNQAKFKDKLSALRSKCERELKEAKDEVGVAVKPQLMNLRSKITRTETDIRHKHQKCAQ